MNRDTETTILQALNGNVSAFYPIATKQEVKDYIITHILCEPNLPEFYAYEAVRQIEGNSPVVFDIPMFGLFRFPNKTSKLIDLWNQTIQKKTT